MTILSLSHYNSVRRFIFITAGLTAIYTFFKLWKKNQRTHHHEGEDDRKVALREIYVELKKVRIVDTPYDWNKAYEKLMQDLSIFKVLGFDCEWVSKREGPHHAVRPVALVQLATLTGFTVLVRLCLLKDDIPESLVNLLADRSILKVGVACYDDGKKLFNDYNLIVRGCVDLRYIAHRKRTAKLGNYGLKDLAGAVLGLKLDKGRNVRCSNWEAVDLTMMQVKYAACDALVGVQVFLALLDDRLKTQNVTGESQEARELWKKALSMCQGIVDIAFKGNQQSKSKHSTKSNSNNKNTSHSSKTSVSRAYAHAYRKQPLYHNCQLLAPDGQILSTCDRKKAEWYIEKGLGVKHLDEPLTVKLTFEPSGRPESEANYYSHEKENICVVCGKNDSYIRKNVIPHEYRKYFPAVLKEHRSHDVVLLCAICHQRSSYLDMILKQEYATLCDAPIASGETSQKYDTNMQLTKIRSAGKALLNPDYRIPDTRREELENLLKTYYGLTTLEESTLKTAAELDPKKLNSKFKPHGEVVVKYIAENDSLITFEKKWRQHFLASMEPKHMPYLWSVDHGHERSSTDK